MKIKGYAKSVIGSRENNEDSFLVSNDKFIYAVADGIGGGEKGEVASKMAVEGLLANTRPEITLTQVIKLLQAAVYNEAMQTFGTPIMGTTLTSLRIVGNEAEICHVGDSRCYFYDGTNLRQMTVDHEGYDENIKDNVLKSYLGIEASVYPLQIQEEKFTLVPGNRILLCSDGLYKQIEDSRILTQLKKHFNEPEILLDLLCEQASKAEYSDNVTIVLILIDFEDPPEDEEKK